MKHQINSSVIFLIILFPLTLLSQEMNNCKIIGAINGECKVVSGEGQNIFMGAGLNLNCFIITDDNLNKQSQLTFPAQIKDIIIEDSIAFIAAGEGVYIVDISIINSPSILSIYHTEEFVESILLTNNYLMVVIRSDVIITIDISDYNNLLEISNFSVSEHSYALKEITMRNDTAFIGSRNGLYIADYSDAEHPELITSYGASNTVWGESIDLSFPVLNGNFLYAGEEYGGFHILDISDVNNIQHLDFFEIGNDIKNLKIFDNKLFVAGSYDGLGIFDISNPSNPVIINQVETDGYVYDIFHDSDSKIFIAKRNTLKVLSTTDYTNLENITQYNVPGVAVDVVVQDSYAYSIHFQNGLYIHDISNPNSPVLLGHLSDYNWSHSLNIANNLAYFTNTNSDVSPSGMYIVDISDPHLLTTIGSFNVEAPSSLLVKDGIAFLGSYTLNGFYVLDVSLPSKPTLLLEYSMGNDYITPRDFYFDEQYLYVAGDVGLFIFDMLDYLSPQLVGSWMTDDDAFGVVVENNLAYVADQSYLNIIDLTDVTNPILLSHLSTPGMARHLEKHGDRIFVTDDAYGIRVVDVSNPEAPYEIANYNNNDWFTGLSIRENKIYGANSGSGIPIIEVSEPNSIGDENNNSAKRFQLFQNYPNPFNPNTLIKYSIPKDGFVNFKIYNILGEEVGSILNEHKKEGTHSIKFCGEDLPSGIYFYRIVSGNYSRTKKMLLLK